jgi:hypothetical protein
MQIKVAHGWRVALATIAVLALGAPAASAAVTIGSSLQIDPSDSGSSEATYIQASLPGGGIVSSPNDGVITLWRMRGYTQGAVPAEILFRVMRPAGSDAFTAISSTSALLPTSLDTHEFPARVPIQKGDYIGLTQTPGNTVFLDCDACPGAGSVRLFGGPFADGQTRTQAPSDNQLVMINADVEADADHDGFGDESQDKCPVDATTQGLCQFSFGKLKKNKNKGTAILPVQVPGAGKLSLSGKGVVPQRPAGDFAVPTGRTVTKAGTVKLLIKAKGKLKKKLNRTGKAKLKLKVTFTPTGGPPSPEAKRVTLRKSS